MNFRDMLLLSGVAERDLADAVREARQATRMVKSASGLMVEVFTRAARKVPEGSRKQLALTVASRIASKVESGAEELLQTREPPKRPERKPRQIAVKVVK